MAQSKRNLLLCIFMRRMRWAAIIVAKVIPIQAMEALRIARD
jgi:hypothetical protein